MAEPPDIPANGGEQPDVGVEATQVVESFARIRDREKRRILLELIRSIAEDQPSTDGEG